MADFMTRARDLGRLFWRSARETGDAAAEMLEQRTQIQRLAGQIRRLDKERNSLIRQIGAKVYALHGQGKVRNEDVLTDCQRIDRIITEVRNVREAIERIRTASLEKGIDIPILSDEAELTDETAEAVSAAPTPAAVTPAGTVGRQDMAEGGPPRGSDGRVEYDELGEELVTQTEGPSQAAPTHDHQGAAGKVGGPSTFTEQPPGDPDYVGRERKAACDDCAEDTVDEEPNPYDK